MIQIIHIRNLEQALNHGLILEKVHRVIKLNQKDWLKPYIDMNTKLREKTKTNFCSFWKSNFWKKYGVSNKILRHKTCNNRKEKKLFSLRTKL